MSAATPRRAVDAERASALTAGSLSRANGCPHGFVQRPATALPGGGSNPRHWPRNAGGNHAPLYCVVAASTEASRNASGGWLSLSVTTSPASNAGNAAAGCKRITSSRTARIRNFASTSQTVGRCAFRVIASRRHTAGEATGSNGDVGREIAAERLRQEVLAL